MARLLIVIAAIASTTVPLLAFDSAISQPKEKIAMIGHDHPIFLKRMIVTATPLPDTSNHCANGSHLTD